MSQRRIALAAGTVVLALAGIATVVESPAPEWSEPAARASEPERVQIEQQIVRIPVSVVPELESLQAAATPKPGSASSVPRGVVSRRALPSGIAARRPESTDSPGLVLRAMNKIAGDGKYKPQPFPRPGG